VFDCVTANVELAMDSSWISSRLFYLSLLQQMLLAPRTLFP
jgi:hypothetical protein